jgi:hypothetical protein
MKITQLKKEVELWAKDHLLNIAIYNKSFKNFIEINQNGINHTINAKKLDPQDLLSMYQLKDILTKATYKGIEKPSHGDRETVINSHIFGTITVIKGIKYRVRIIVREISVNAREKNKHFFYHHTLIEKV